MAKAKPTTPSTKPVEKTPSKAKMGIVTESTIRQGIGLLNKAAAELLAMADVMRESGVTELMIEGPKLLPRGVNSVLQFQLKLDAAMKRRDRM